MEIRKFQQDTDLPRLEAFLRNQYLANRNMTSWLPARLHDLIYRVAPHERDGGRKESKDYIFLWEDQGEIVASILPDGENVYFSIQTGFEYLFPDLLAYSEKNCTPLFQRSEDGSVKFWVAVSDGLPYMRAFLEQSGYARFAENDYDNFVYPAQTQVSVTLPAGFRLLYGEEYPNEENKWGALHLGFHPDHEDSDYKTSMNPYHSRKQSSLYPDSFECLVVDENSGEQNNVCAYCFVYVDVLTNTAFIEPVSTREKYQHKGIGRAMMHGAILRCKEMGIEKCYVNSFGWRKNFYNAAGFITEDSTGFWYKILK